MDFNKKVSVPEDSAEYYADGSAAYDFFEKLWLNALDEPDLEVYIGCGYDIGAHCITHDEDDYVSLLKEIHFAAHATVEEIISRSGLTQQEFCTGFCIQPSIVKEWISGKQECPEYTRLMLCRQLGFLSEPELVRDASLF